MSENAAPADVAVVGAGIVGLSIAWRSAAAGLTVTLVDPTPRRGASWVAAGMLAPVTELHYGEEELLRLNLASAQRWPSFAAELEEASGLPAGFDVGGTLTVAADRDDREALAALTDYQRELGLKVETITTREARRREPTLAPNLCAAVNVPDDQRADPRQTTAALWAAATQLGVRHVAERAVAVTTDPTGRRVTGVATADGGEVRAGTVVLAAAWESSALLRGLPGAPRPPLRPVKGQILTLRARAGDDEPLLHGAVRALVHGSAVYLVPRRDGRVVVGATVEEQGADTGVTAGAVYELLRDAALVVPGVSELELVEALAGLRPATPDNAPLLGTSAEGPEGLVLAAGHYRNGILLSAVTADLITELLTSGDVPELAAPFTPDRFARDAGAQR